MEAQGRQICTWGLLGKDMVSLNKWYLCVSLLTFSKNEWAQIYFQMDVKLTSDPDSIE